MKKNLKALSDAELLESTHQAVAAERESTAYVLAHLEEVERRKLHLQMGYSSMLDYCVRVEGYTRDEAHFRVSAMRLVREVPESGPALEQGRLTLTTLAQAQSFFRQERKEGAPVALEQKKEVLLELQGKSSREVKQVLAVRSGKPASSTLSFEADEELLRDLERIRALWGNQDLSLSEFIAKMAKFTLSKIDPRAKQLA